jgi:carboxymethylenebutenolidase
MKKILFLTAAIVISLTAFAQGDITVCHTSTTEKFAMFASDKDFNAAHLVPRNYVHVSAAGGKMIKFKTPDGSQANGYLLEAKKKTNNWIFVIQEWWGLNENIKRQAEDLYNALGNVNVIALDMYDGKVATDKNTAGQYMQQFKQERGDAIYKGAISYVGSAAKIGTVGWCFGGGQSLLASLAAGKQAVACVIYYGMPVEDVEVLKTLNAEVLGIFGTQDEWINADVVKKFEANMRAAEKDLIVKTYEADHGFANPSNPLGVFNEAAYKSANELTIDFFKARLK